MKKTFASTLFLLGAAAGALSQTPETTNYTIVDRGPNHRVWQRIEYRSLPDGGVSPLIHRYTELSMGMHFMRQGLWTESSDQISLLPDGTGAAATNAQCPAFFPSDIYDGVIDLATPDSPPRHLRCRPLALVYFDGTNSQTIGILTNSTAQLLPSGNEIIYTNCFSNVRCDLLVSFARSGLQCDLIFRSAPATPEDLGLDNSSGHVRIQLLSEYFETEDPVAVSTATSSEGLSDTTFQFGGATLMPRGQAFAIGKLSQEQPDTLSVHPSGARIYKSWLHLGQRTFLCEETFYASLAEQFHELALAEPEPTHSLFAKANAAKPGQPGSSTRSLRALVLPPSRPVRPSAKQVQLAKADLSGQPGVLWDWQTVLSTNNMVFSGDMTWFVPSNANVNLAGTTTLEGNAVIKIAPKLPQRTTRFSKPSRSMARSSASPPAIAPA